VRKATAWLLMALIAAALLAADFFILTSGPGLSRIVRLELAKALDGIATFARASASKDSPLRPYPREIVVQGLRVVLSPKLFEDLSRREGRPIRESLAASNLPRVLCEEGVVVLDFPEVFAAGRAPEFAVRALSITPFDGYRVHVDGAVDHSAYGAWRVAGEIDLDSGAMRLTLRAASLRITPAMREPLADNPKDVFDKYRPDGLCDVAVTLSKVKDRDLDFTATLRARDMALLYRNFPFQVERIDGEIDFFLKGFRVKHMTGRHGAATVRFDGAAGGYEAEADYRFRLEIDSLALDADVRAALDDAGRKTWDLFAPTGKADVRGRVTREYGPGKEARIPLDLAIREASFRFKDLPYEVRNAAGDVRIDGNDVDIKHLVSREEETVIDFSGAIRDIAADASIDLVIDARALRLDARLRSALSGEALKIWDTFAPSGPADVRWNVKKEKGGEPVHSARARARGNGVLWKEIPLPVTGLAGEIEFGPAGVTLRHLAGEAFGASLEVHGTIASDQTAVRVVAVGLPLDERVKPTLPADVATIINSLRLGGKASFDLDYKAGKGDRKRITLNLRLLEGTVATEPKFENLEGTIALTGTINPEPGLVGFLTLPRARVAGKQLTDLTANFSYIGARATFWQIKASAYGGTVLGEAFWIDTKSGEFSGSFKADGLELREYSRDVSGYSEKMLSGKLSLELPEVRGRTDDAASIAGKGRLSIRDGLLWDVPILASVFTLNPQDLFKRTNRFDAGAVDFELKDKHFVVPSLVFSSSSVSLLGYGKIGFDGKLDLNLKTETGFFGLDFFLFKIVTGLFDTLKNAFHGVKVTGTFEKPEVSQQLLPGLRK
jgi:hypothetical protein